MACEAIPGQVCDACGEPATKSPAGRPKWRSQDAYLCKTCWRGEPVTVRSMIKERRRVKADEAAKLEMERRKNLVSPLSRFELLALELD